MCQPPKPPKRTRTYQGMRRPLALGLILLGLTSCAARSRAGHALPLRRRPRPARKSSRNATLNDCRTSSFSLALRPLESWRSDQSLVRSREPSTSTKPCGGPGMSMGTTQRRSRSCSDPPTQSPCTGTPKAGSSLGSYGTGSASTPVRCSRPRHLSLVTQPQLERSSTPTTGTSSWATSDSAEMPCAQAQRLYQSGTKPPLSSIHTRSP